MKGWRRAIQQHAKHIQASIVCSRAAGSKTCCQGTRASHVSCNPSRIHQATPPGGLHVSLAHVTVSSQRTMSRSRGSDGTSYVLVLIVIEL